MKYETKKYTVRELTKGYVDSEELGCSSMNGHLDIRPAYQREFIYKNIQRDAVIETLNEDMPIGILHWAKTSDGKYEILDGQQRTISIAEYVVGNFSVDYKYFNNLSSDKQKAILDYEILVNIYDGNDDEKLKWFQKINIAGEKLTDQELRNATYTGPWLTSAKKYFSKTNGPAYNLSKELVKGSPIRQDFLETALKWQADSTEVAIEKLMAKNQHKVDAHELWDYFRAVIEWVERIFEYRREMKGLEWGILYNKYKDVELNKESLEKKVKKLLMDDDVTKKPGIYRFILTGDQKHLSIRGFTDSNKREAYEKQDGNCSKCKKHFPLSGMDADHIKPWSKGGKTLASNLQMLCKKCNRSKSNL